MRSSETRTFSALPCHTPSTSFFPSLVIPRAAGIVCPWNSIPRVSPRGGRARPEVAPEASSGAWRSLPSSGRSSSSSSSRSPPRSPRSHPRSKRSAHRRILRLERSEGRGGELLPRDLLERPLGRLRPPGAPIPPTSWAHLVRDFQTLVEAGGEARRLPVGRRSFEESSSSRGSGLRADRGRRYNRAPNAARRVSADVRHRPNPRCGSILHGPSLEDIPSRHPYRVRRFDFARSRRGPPVPGCLPGAPEARRGLELPLALRRVLRRVLVPALPEERLLLRGLRGSAGDARRARGSRESGDASGLGRLRRRARIPLPDAGTEPAGRPRAAAAMTQSGTRSRRTS